MIFISKKIGLFVFLWKLSEFMLIYFSYEGRNSHRKYKNEKIPHSFR